MQYDSFKGLATLRSLAYPGYTFIYSVRAAAIDWSHSSCFVWFVPCARGRVDDSPRVAGNATTQTEMKEYDSLYLGTGEANKDMMFMIA
jgi:hypothetical protein